MHAILTFLTLIFSSALILKAENAESLAIPDFTKGDYIPSDAPHDWNLGATGMRGWIFSDKMVTYDARQILVTQVEKGSPAARDFVIGDVILGVAGKPFSYDPRTEFGKALTIAESNAGGGKLTLTRWREGKSEEVSLRLQVLGDYSATAPYACKKSAQIVQQGCAALAEKMKKSDYKEHPIVRSINALALLASGDSSYLGVVKKEAKWAADLSETSMQAWSYGYTMMFLSEYVMATGDQSVMPGLRRLAMETANGQSAVGSWGHGFALPNGNLSGYGMMNSPGIPLTISLALAKGAGVDDPEIARAIELSAKLLRFYIGKGAIPYGDHHPWIQTHDDNGKCGMAAVLFNLLNEPEGAKFFSRMSVASHGAERDTGHTGNFFNILWAMPGVVQSGPQASGAWMHEFGSWYFDLARRWDGTFGHQGPPQPNNDSYANWDCTGAYLLAYAMPREKIYLTGKGPQNAPQISATEAQLLISDGRGWNSKDRHSVYDEMNSKELLERLTSWSPVVRERAAMALGRRENTPIQPLLKLLKSSDIESRYGACQALIALRERGKSAIHTLRDLLEEEDLWLRIKAAEALASMGEPAMKAVPELLELFSKTDPINDPREMLQRYLCFALFDQRGMLHRSLEGVDRELLYQAVKIGLKNQDGRARSSITSVYRNLSTEEIQPLLPAIMQAVAEPSPSGEMFADEIRVEGLRLLAKHRVAEGIPLCVKYTREQNSWASQIRTPLLMEILATYGTHAKSVIPELKKIADYFEKDEKNFPPHLMVMKAKTVRDAIDEIKSSTETPELIHMN